MKEIKIKSGIISFGPDALKIASLDEVPVDAIQNAARGNALHHDIRINDNIIRYRGDDNITREVYYSDSVKLLVMTRVP